MYNTYYVLYYLYYLLYYALYYLPWYCTAYVKPCQKRLGVLIWWGEEGETLERPQGCRGPSQYP